MTDSFLKYLQFEKRYSPQTISAYQTDLRQFQAFLDDAFDRLPAQEANHGIVRAWVVKLVEDKLDPASVNRKIACLRSYFKFLIKQGVVTKDPLAKIKILKTRKKLPHFVKESEMTQMLDPASFNDEFEQRRDQLILELLYGTGMRRAELIGLRDGSVKLADRTVKVLGKRNKERVIPFAANLVKLIEAYRRIRNRDVNRKNDLLLVTAAGAALYPVLVNRIVAKYLQGANVDKKSPHVLRHTYATHLLNKGAEINAVKELLGHSSLAATQVYTHNSMEKIKKAFDQAHPKA